MTAKPDAMTLWTHAGSLAEAMRSTPVRVTPAAYAAASMDTCLILGDGVTVAIANGERVYTAGATTFARMRLDGAVLVVTFRGPGMQLDKRFYRALGDDWFEYRRPATRDPRPDLEADVGTLLGEAYLLAAPPRARKKTARRAKRP